MVNLRRTARIGLTSLFALVVARAANAHSDPIGDVHPVVIGASGVFQVCFRVAEPYSGLISKSLWFRTLHKPDGTLIAPRHRILDESQVSSLDEAMWRRGNPAKEHAPVIDWSQNLRPSQATPTSPARLVLRNWRNNAIQEEPLLFDVPDCNDLTSQLVSDAWAGILWGSSGEENGIATSHSILNLTWFWRGGVAKPVTRKLGACATIYDFAVASNLVWVADRLWVTWVRDAGKPEAPAWETMLSSFDPKTGKVTTKGLPGISHWNSHLSLATTDGWLCAAWHCTKDGNYPGTAVIVTAFEKIEAP